ncbi:hypothetical protein DFJ74DRAFT_335957 [Hyaloraphidium curvatum]|nr:hypothetical protein DFJ74DRAFT_335957 [Hyaloraphidium curvatum]
MSSSANVPYDVTQTCNANAPQSFTLQGSGDYFVVTQWSGATCSGTYLTAAAVIANQCVPLGFIGIPAFGRPACAPGAASGTMAFFGNDACTIPFTGVGTFDVTAGNCGTVSLGPITFAMTARCASVVDGSPAIPFAAISGSTTATVSTVATGTIASSAAGTGTPVSTVASTGTVASSTVESSAVESSTVVSSTAVPSTLATSSAAPSTAAPSTTETAAPSTIAPSTDASSTATSTLASSTVVSSTIASSSIASTTGATSTVTSSRIAGGNRAMAGLVPALAAAAALAAMC